MKEERVSCVYGLSSSEDGEIKYVGQTIQPLVCRLRQHLSEKSNSKKACWIKSIKSKGFELKATVLHEGNFTQDELDSLEIFEIKNLMNAIGHDCKNGDYGGKSGGFSRETLGEEKWGAYIEKQRVNALGSNNNFFGKKHTKETRQHLSNAKRGKKLTEAHIEALLKTRKRGEDHHWYGRDYGIPHTKESRAKISDSNSKVWVLKNTSSGETITFNGKAKAAEFLGVSLSPLENRSTPTSKFFGCPIKSKVDGNSYTIHKG